MSGAAYINKLCHELDCDINELFQLMGILDLKLNLLHFKLCYCMLINTPGSNYVSLCIRHNCRTYRCRIHKIEYIYYLWDLIKNDSYFFNNFINNDDPRDIDYLVDDTKNQRKDIFEDNPVNMDWC